MLKPPVAGRGAIPDWSGQLAGAGTASQMGWSCLTLSSTYFHLCLIFPLIISSWFFRSLLCVSFFFLPFFLFVVDFPPSWWETARLSFFFLLQKTLTRFMGIFTRHSLFSTFCVLLFFFLNSFPYAVGFILFTSLHLNRTVNTLPVLLLLNLRIVFFLNWEMCVLYPEKVSGYFNIEPKERVSRYSIRVLTATNLLAFYLNRYGNSGRTELLFFFFFKKKGKDYWFLVILEGSSSTPG